MTSSSIEARGELVSNIPDYPITPAELLIPQHYWGAFDHFQTEISARWVVQLSQELGGWIPFTEARMEDFYKRGEYNHFNFNRLVLPQRIIDTPEGNWRMAGGGWIAEIDGKYHVTTAFVEQIQKSLAVTEAQPKQE